MTISVMSKCLRSENEVRETGYMDSVKQTPLSRWDAEFFQNKQLGLLPRFGAYIIQNVYDFDFRLFGATNHEYSAVEPRQRLVLLVAAETFFCFRSKRLEKPLDIKSRAGIYVGCSWNDFELLCRETGLQEYSALNAAGFSGSVISGRVAYHFNFNGPTISVDTACSSSLVALSVGIRNMSYSFNMNSLVCGVNLLLSPSITLHFLASGMLTFDGRCKTLDSKADGYVRSEGCSSLMCTEQNGKATGKLVGILSGLVNQDGRSNGLTAPNGNAQSELLFSSFTSIECDKIESLQVQMHGTGTALGDPIESSSYHTLFHTKYKTFSAIFSAEKSINGHSEPASGLSSISTACENLFHENTPEIKHLEAVTNALGRQILTDASLVDEGMDSLAAVELGSTLQTATGTSMPATLAFDYPTIDAIVDLVSMDPQQRILLESFHQINSENLEFDKATNLKKVTNIAIGATKSLYGMEQLKWDQYKINPYMGTGMELSVLCGRISYTFGFKGPSVCVDTACSSSLVATQLAANTIISMESQIAYAGGVSLNIGLLSFQIGSAANMLSSDGRCKTLDIRADGYAKGECCGVMRITPDIETQSATIDVVAKLGGCGINQDGRSSSLTAPNGPSQQTLIVDVLKRANYNASGVDRLEMHGTGTSLGDPIEVGAALEVLVSSPKSMQTTSSVPFLSSQKRNLTLEGAKTRTGHCEPGAGTVGLMFAISRMSQRLISSLTHLRILTDASLVDEGMDSLAAVELGSTLQTATGTSMPATLAFDYPTIDAIVDLVSMDPQQRILLESFHQINSENLEFDKATNLKKVTNIAIGATKSLYGMEQLKWDQYKINPYMGTGMELSVLCGPISYTFGFKGPSVCVDTACSSSLVATQLAANTIISMESRLHMQEVSV
ncbi:unnamed protein product [Bathycoccus prasinos]